MVGRGTQLCEASALLSEDGLAITTGVIMENTAGMLGAVAKEVEASKETLSGLVLEVQKLDEEITPALLKQIKELRSSRMAIVAEVRDALTAMRDIRKFFLEADFETEMARLERFVRLCSDIRALKADGTFDAVIDSSLRLAVGEPK